MITNLGIKINRDEANVLLASADKNKDGVLDLKEFHDFLKCPTNDIIDIDS